MAKGIIKFSTGRKALFVTPEKGLQVFNVLIGKQEPESPAQTKFIGTVDRVFLPRNIAPQAYLDMYPLDDEAKAQAWYNK